MTGLFVEDENLFRLSSLPFACEVDYTSGTSRPLQSPSVERALHAAAQRMEQALTQLAEQLKIRWTFQVTRGLLAREILAAATEVDFVVIGQEGCVSPRQTHKVPSGAPVVAVFDGTEPAYSCLEIAEKLARDAARPLTVVVVPPDGAEPGSVRNKCQAWLHTRSRKAEVRELRAGQFDLLRDIAAQLRASVLIVPRASQGIDDANVDKLVKKLPCPLVIVR